MPDAHIRGGGNRQSGAGLLGQGKVWLGYWLHYLFSKAKNKLITVLQECLFKTNLEHILMALCQVCFSQKPQDFSGRFQA